MLPDQGDTQDFQRAIRNAAGKIRDWQLTRIEREALAALARDPTLRLGDFSIRVSEGGGDPVLCVRGIPFGEEPTWVGKPQGPGIRVAVSVTEGVGCLVDDGDGARLALDSGAEQWLDALFPREAQPANVGPRCWRGKRGRFKVTIEFESEGG